MGAIDSWWPQDYRCAMGKFAVDGEREIVSVLAWVGKEVEGVCCSMFKRGGTVCYVAARGMLECARYVRAGKATACCQTARLLQADIAP